MEIIITIDDANLAISSETLVTLASVTFSGCFIVGASCKFTAWVVAGANVDGLLAKFSRRRGWAFAWKQVVVVNCRGSVHVLTAHFLAILKVVFVRLVALFWLVTGTDENVRPVEASGSDSVGGLGSVKVNVETVLSEGVLGIGMAISGGFQCEFSSCWICKTKITFLDIENYLKISEKLLKVYKSSKISVSIS